MRVSPALASALLLTAAFISAGCGQPSSPHAPDAAATQKAASEKKKPKVFIAKDDLSAIRARKTLRILVFQNDASFLQGGPAAAQDRDLAVQFARSLGLEPEIVSAPTFGELFTYLEEGKTDLVAARLTVTKVRSERVAFTRPTAVVKEIVVGKKGAPGHPKSIAELSGRKVYVWGQSAYAESLRALGEKELGKGQPPPIVVPVPEHYDDDDVAERVASGEYPLSVFDSDLFAGIQTYNDQLEKLFVLKEGRQIAWAVRQDQPALKAAADAWLIEHAMTTHTRERFVGDLEGIKKRGVLRVLTRNNPVTYFLYRGAPRGFDYELVALMAKQLGVRLEMVVPPAASDLIPWLHDGRGDLIAAAFTVTAARKQQVAFSLPYLFIDEMMVGKRGADNPTSIEALKGRTVTVRPSSSYAHTLKQLQARVEGLTIAPAPEALETEQLLDQVAAGKIALTVADSHILAVQQIFASDLVGLFPLSHVPEGAVDARGKPRTSGAKEIAFAMRKENPALQKWVDRFVRRTYRGLDYNMAKTRYFENKKNMARAVASVDNKGQLSPYDDLIQKYSKKYGLDWRLMAAQAYQESRFNPNAQSWVGALGLFQVMPATGKELGFSNLRDPEQGIHAGIKYMHRLINQWDQRLPFRQRIRFALASYNAGRGHVLDARRLAARRGWNADRWFGNVEKAMLLLKDPKIARTVRHGYCRGDEPVAYVSQIQLRYDNYVKLFPDVATAAEAGESHATQKAKAP